MKNKALTLTELLVAIAIISLLMVILLPVLMEMRYRRFRLTCANNLSQIARAMHFYNNDYDDKFPCAGGPKAAWGPTPNWMADTLADAYGLGTKQTTGRAAISASLYLLARYEQAIPASFICKGDQKTTEFVPAKYGVCDKELIDLWDFGPDPSKHCSYTYHLPYGLYALTTSNLPGMAVAADRNPFIDSPGAKAVPITEFGPDGTQKQQRKGNSPSHKKDGQNVLFVDCHVTFQKAPYCGINDDNIYTHWEGPDIRRGTPPTLDSQPRDKRDSLLVHDPPITE